MGRGAARGVREPVAGDVGAGDRGKPWFFPAMYFLMAAKDVDPSMLEALLYLCGRSDSAGYCVIPQAAVAKEIGITPEGLRKIQKRAVGGGYLVVTKVPLRIRFYNAVVADRTCCAYQLTEKITGLTTCPGGWSPERGSGEHGSGERCSGERGSGERCSGESEPCVPGNGGAAIPERGSGPLQDQKKEKEKTPDRARAPEVAAREHPREALNKLSLRIRNNEPLDPNWFRVTVNEAIEDRIAIPDDVSGAIARLRKNARLETTGIGKIEWIGWNEPTSFRELLAIPSPPPDENLEAVIARAMAAMKR